MCLILLTGLSGLNFHFLPNGDGVPQYKILNFRQTSPGQFAWQMVGTFEENQLKVTRHAGSSSRAHTALM